MNENLRMMLPLRGVKLLVGLGSALMLALTSSALAQASAKEPAPPRAPDLASNPAAETGKINPALPTLFIAGDSTAAKGAGERQQGWGVPFADYFDPAKVNVVNRARGGRSSRTFITEGLWDQLIADVKPGDVVLIQFGHNDAGALNDEPPPPLRARGSLPGLGEESKAIENVLTKKHEVVHTFGWYMRKMIADTQAKGARPIVLSLTVRDVWQKGRLERASGRYSQWAAAIANEAGVSFIDLTNLVADRFEPMGEAAVKALYPQDHTHFNAIGADLHAAQVVSGLKGLRPSPVDQWLSAKGSAVAKDPLVWLNLPRPAEPSLPTLFLIGDSTVRNGRGDGVDGQWGWGDYVGPYFDPAKLNVVNRAVGGLSSRTYLTQGHWDHVLSMLRPGDFVMMQFGHNDDAALNDATRARGTIKGIGEESEAIENLLTKQPEVVHSYGWYLRKFIADSRAKGATPIVCSPIPRKTWKDGKIVRGKESYAGWSEQVAQNETVPFIDLNEMIAARYDVLGEAKVEPMFADPHTHTSKGGAELNAEVVVAGLKQLKDDPLATFLRHIPKDLQLFLLIGQSNMAGRAMVEPQDKIPHPRIFMLTKELFWLPATDPLHFDKPNVIGVGPGMGFARAIAEAEPKINIGLIPAAVGGTSLEDWSPGGKLYKDAVTRARAAKKHGRLVGILWHQGEADSANPKAAVYVEKFGKWVAQLRADLDAETVPVIVGETGQFRPNAVAINAALATVPQHVPLTAFVSAAGLTDKGDLEHFSAASQREFGQRYAKAWLELQRTNLAKP